MITINLLPVSAIKERYKGRVFLTALTLIILVCAASMGSLKMMVLDSNLADMRKQSSALDATLAKIKTQVAGAEKETGLTVRKWKQFAAIVEIEERRRDQTRLLNEIVTLVPKESAWLTSLAHNNKGKLELKGISKDKETISGFLTRLESAHYLDRASVFPGEINQSMRLKNLLLTTFSIRADTKFPAPIILEEGMEQFNLPSAKQFYDLVQAAAPDLATGILPGNQVAAPGGPGKRK